MTLSKTEWSHVAKSKKELQKLLGKDAEIVDRLPNRRQEDPEHPNKPETGNFHELNQIISFHWAIYMESQRLGGICGDGCRTGRTHETFLLSLGASLYWEKRGKAATAPTLVVVPKGLIAKTFQNLHDQLGVSWTVYENGRSTVSTKKVFLGKQRPLFSAPTAGKAVIVASYSQLQRMTATHELSGLFERIILDEAQAIRRCDNTVQGRVLKAMNGRYR